MNNNEEATQVPAEEIVIEPIVREVGERVAITGGRDYSNPVIRVVPNTHAEAGEHEKAAHISQGKGMGVSLSLASLEAAVRWLKGEA